MDINKVYQGSCFDLVKQLPDNSIDLIVTSPPYADTKSYGKGVNVLHPDHYVDWILPLFVELYRVMKPSASFIFNIDDRCVKKARHPYCFELIHRVSQETDMVMYDYYLWCKRSVLPCGNDKRLNHNTEFIFHFVKDVDKVAWYMDNVREEYCQSSLNRVKTPIKQYKTNDDGSKDGDGDKMLKLNAKGKVPNNIFSFRTNGTTKGNKHPAPFHPELPTWFIEALSKEGDLVLDPFMGSGTTAEVCMDLGRNWLGFELNEVYIKMIEERLDNNTEKDFF